MEEQDITSLTTTPNTVTLEPSLLPKPSLQTTPSSSKTYCIQQNPNLKKNPTVTPIPPKPTAPSPLIPTPVSASAARTAAGAVTLNKQNIVTGIQSLGANIVTIKNGQLIVRGPNHAAATQIAKVLSSGTAKLANLNGKQVLLTTAPVKEQPAAVEATPGPRSLLQGQGQQSSSSVESKLKNKLQKQMEKPLVKDDAWYLVGRRWFNLAKEYLALEGKVEESSNPGPIDNRGLWKEDGTDIRELIIAGGK